jgi:hypothetical protein
MVLTGKPLKIEIVYDGPPGAGDVAVGQPSLLNRIGQIAGTHKAQTVRGGGVPPKY